MKDLNAIAERLEAMADERRNLTGYCNERFRGIYQRDSEICRDASAYIRESEKKFGRLYRTIRHLKASVQRLKKGREA